VASQIGLSPEVVSADELHGMPLYAGAMTVSEFDLIAHIRSRSGTRGDVVLGIGDDAAVMDVPAGWQLVVTTDTLNAGVHFPHASAIADIGWKSLAVNLSDLAAMGAMPAWCTLSLSMPQSDAAWVDQFLDGFLPLATLHGVALVGGDTTRGSLSISVTAMGLVEAGVALRRDGACAGDDIWVTGTLGDAAAALCAVIEGESTWPTLRARLDRPTPRVAAGRRLLGIAHSCIDVSDGLLADLGHICESSAVGAEIELDLLPVSAVLATLDPAARWHWQAAGGDDYELCFTAPPSLREPVLQAMDFAESAVTRIGRVVAGQGVCALQPDGTPWQPRKTGYDHFRG